MSSVSNSFRRCLRVVGAIALSLVAGACASTGATPKPFPMPSAAERPEPPAPSPNPQLNEADLQAGSVPTATRIIDTALQLRGTPYRDGGSTPQGFDCSGFTQWVFAQHGLRLPREVREQFGQGEAIDASALRPGDLVFFSTVAPGASHVGISLGGDTFVHAPSSTGVVRVERVSLPYWSRRFVGVRRIVAD